MNWIVARIKWIMLVSGALTCTMLYAAVGLSKLVFIGLVLSHGRQYLGHQAGLAVGVDLVMVALFIGHPVGVRSSTSQAPS